MRRAAVPLALLALAAGAACLVLGISVLRERGSLDRAQTALAAPLPPVNRVGDGGVGATLLGTGGERAALTAAADWIGARASTLASLSNGGRARATAELGRLAANGPAARRSWAYTLLAVLELDQAQAGGKQGSKHSAAALAAFEAAVAADPANARAKRDLELLLTIQDQAKRQSQQRGRSSSSGKNRRKTRTRAGLSAPGWGW